MQHLVRRPFAIPRSKGRPFQGVLAGVYAMVAAGSRFLISRNRLLAYARSPMVQGSRFSSSKPFPKTFWNCLTTLNGARGTKIDPEKPWTARTFCARETPGLLLPSNRWEDADAAANPVVPCLPPNVDGIFSRTDSLLELLRTSPRTKIRRPGKSGRQPWHDLAQRLHGPATVVDVARSQPGGQRKARHAVKGRSTSGETPARV